MPDWNPDLYLKFSDQRARPAADLIAQIKLENSRRIIDLGCGTGNSTEQVHARWPQAQITGLDSSASMLKQAAERHPDWQWDHAEIDQWRPESSFDLIFSNAALHWLGDHAGLFPRLFQHVSHGGALAVQMPNNFHSPAHQAMKKVAANSRWSAALTNASEKFGVQPVAFYYEVLRKLASHLDIWETEYLQIMDGPKAVHEWIRSTGMRAYLERLADDEQRADFDRLCLEEMEKAYEANDQGKVLFPFKRIFIVAYR
ncbi:MAG TPA: trans-aconitate 2-methyltransferase [Candidatus Angelobacter sp.]|nr:trans-aconitate 2-methyltransferase [Candidatus Angelobacter sp.]